MWYRIPSRSRTNITAVQHMHACRERSLTWLRGPVCFLGSCQAFHFFVYSWVCGSGVPHTSWSYRNGTGILTAHLTTDRRAGDLRFTHADTCHPCVGGSASRLVSTGLVCGGRRCSELGSLGFRHRAWRFVADTRTCELSCLGFFPYSGGTLHRKYIQQPRDYFVGC